MLRPGVWMGRLLMTSSLEELFNSIENSKTYQEYLKMKDILNKDSEIKDLLDEIKELEKEATYLEFIGDETYKELDEEIKNKAEILNNKQVYQEYLNKMDEFNEELATSSKMIEKYVEEKV